jgi:hypothetical protein
MTDRRIAKFGAHKKAGLAPYYATGRHLTTFF